MILLIIKWICFSYIFINFRPIQDILDKLRTDYNKSKSKTEYIIIFIITIIKKILTCLKCFSFNFSILFFYISTDMIFFDIIMTSSIVSVGSVLLEKLINSLPDKLF